MPPVHFSNLKVHLGTIIQFGVVGMPAVALMPVGAIVGAPIPGMAIPVRSIIIMLDIKNSFLRTVMVAVRTIRGIQASRSFSCDALLRGDMLQARNYR